MQAVLVQVVPHVIANISSLGVHEAEAELFLRSVTPVRVLNHIAVAVGRNFRSERLGRHHTLISGGVSARIKSVVIAWVIIGRRHAFSVSRGVLALCHWRDLQPVGRGGLNDVLLAGNQLKLEHAIGVRCHGLFRLLRDLAGLRIVAIHAHFNAFKTLLADLGRVA